MWRFGDYRSVLESFPGFLVRTSWNSRSINLCVLICVRSLLDSVLYSSWSLDPNCCLLIKLQSFLSCFLSLEPNFWRTCFAICMAKKIGVNILKITEHWRPVFSFFSFLVFSCQLVDAELCWNPFSSNSWTKDFQTSLVFGARLRFNF